MSADETPGISEAFVLACDAIVRATGTTPLPPGLTTARVGDWTLTINNGREPLQHEGQPIGPWEMVGRHEVYLAFASFNPLGGMIGGRDEASFIADMRAAGATIRGENA